MVSKYGVGLDTLDLAAMERRGVLLGWTGGVNRRSVAELVIVDDRVIAQGPFRLRRSSGRQMVPGPGPPVDGENGRHSGVRACREGCGRVPQVFDCRVLSCDISDFPEFYSKHHIVPMKLEELLREADIVSLHLPLNASTKDLLNAERLGLMKPGAYLINTARGGSLDEVKLKEMLKSGRLAGAALDVFADEPPADRELLSLPDVIATPHIGGSTEEAVLAMGRAAVEGWRTRARSGKWSGYLRPYYRTAAGDR